MMEWSGTMMMIGLGVVWILFTGILVLGSAALTNYLRTTDR